MFASDSELFIPSDEALHIPTFEDLVERFKNFIRVMFSDEEDEAPILDFPDAVRTFEKYMTNVEIDAIESSKDDFLTAYNEVLLE